MSTSRPSILLCIVIFALTSRELAAQPVPLGPETRVDTGVGSTANCPLLAVAPDRSFEIVWDPSSLPPFTIQGRHFAPDDTPTNPTEVRISPGDFYDTPTAYLLSPVANGFRVLFNFFDETLENPPTIRRQRLDSQGKPVGSSDVVGDAATRWVWPGSGDVLYAVSYQTRQKNLVFRQIGSTGRPTGPKIVVNDRPVDNAFLRTVPLKGQEFLAVWTGTSVATRRAPSSRQVIRARRFRQGMPEGKEFDVNVSPGGAPGRPPFLANFGLAFAADRRSGGFAVAWTVSDAPGTANPNTSIRLRFFDASGRPVGPEVAATPAAPAVRLVDTAFDDAGNLLLLWRPPLRNVLRARLFASTGGGSAGPVSPAFQVNSEASEPFNLPACGDLAWTGDSWRISWMAVEPSPVTGGGAHAIFLRRFMN